MSEEETVVPLPEQIHSHILKYLSEFIGKGAVESRRNITFPSDHFYWHGEGVIVYDLIGHPTCDDIDKSYFFKLIDRDDVVVVTKGVIEGLDEAKWNLESILKRVGIKTHHKFKVFKRDLQADSSSPFVVTNEEWKMSGNEYLKYMNAIRNNEDNITLTTKDGVKEININATAIYMVDFSFKYHGLADFDTDFCAKTKIPEILPGNVLCFTNSVS